MTTTFKEVQIVCPVSVKQVRNLLVSAFEGGSNYWMFLRDYEFPPNTTREDFAEGGKYAVQDDFSENCWHPAYVLPFVKGGGVVLQDTEEEVSYTLTLEKMMNGLTAMAQKYPHHFRNIVDENDDAETADVFLQCSLFGELVYG